MNNLFKKLPKFFFLMLMVLALSVPAFAATSTTTAGAPTTTKKVTTKTTQKKVKLSKPATKTYSKTLPATTSTKTAVTTDETDTEIITITTKTVVKKVDTEKYTKKSKIKLVKTVTTTTVTTTTKTELKQISGTTTDILAYAPKADARLVKAWNKFGFTLTVNPSLLYTSDYDIRARKIEVKHADNSIYFELGNVLAWASGREDQTAEFLAAFKAEKSNLQGLSSYFRSTPEDFFADCFEQYCLNKTALKAARPKSYACIEKALNRLTDKNINAVYNLYKNFWK